MNSQLSKTPIVLDGVIWNLCGDFAELVKAEAFFSQSVSDVNLAGAIVGVKDQDSALHACMQILPCALHAYHPEVTWADAQTMLDRAVTQDDGSIVCAIMRDIWPPKTAETEAANGNLHCDLEALANAEEFFMGKAGLLLICVENGGFKLEHVWRVFPCALHHARPELSLEQARRLMTLPSVPSVIVMLELENRRASQDARNRFAARVAAVTSEEDKREFLFRIIARDARPGIIAQA